MQQQHKSRGEKRFKEMSEVSPFRLNVSAGHHLFFRRLRPWPSFVMVWASPCPYPIAVQDGEDEEQKKKATATSKRAPYYWSTTHGRTERPSIFLFTITRWSSGHTTCGGACPWCFCFSYSFNFFYFRYFSKIQFGTADKCSTTINATVFSLEGLQC